MVAGTLGDVVSAALCLRKQCAMRVWWGAVAQLGERLVRNEEVSGSIPLSSTIDWTTLRHVGNPGYICVANRLVRSALTAFPPPVCQSVFPPSHLAAFWRMALSFLLVPDRTVFAYFFALDSAWLGGYCGDSAVPFYKGNRW